MVDIDLQKFCGSDDTLSLLSKPFTQGAYTYATDRAVIVRVPKVDGVAQLDSVVAIDADRPFKHFSDQSFAPLPKLNLPPLSGPKVVACTECDGRGTEHDCPDCNCVCDACDGTGKEEVETKISTSLGGATLQLKYVHLIASLPRVEISTQLAASLNGPVFFRFDGGEGALMPMTRPCENHIQIEGAA
ncbi:hypothetical protein [Afipia carboxidovorans]|uniref:hypothetical protein n=1 Tax=Afipia carboxidovorans TaxID=40137 RepID=UPI00308C37C6|nr:hypothetical protein CRBSH125_09920 [Afipia carboxidovorans]